MYRGDFTGDGYEDLLALRKDADIGDWKLWVHPNNGFGFACTACRTGDYQRHELTTLDPADNHWKNGVKQILAIGDVDGALDIDGDGTPDIPGAPDLLVNDGTNLWLYYGDPNHSQYLDLNREPVLLATGDSMSDGSNTLDKITLAAPGDWSNDGQTDLLARFDTGGGLYLYDSINPDLSPDGQTQVDPVHRTAIGSGWYITDVPLYTAAPDANNNGDLDIWLTIAGSTDLSVYPDITSTGAGTLTTAASDFADYQSIG